MFDSFRDSPRIAQTKKNSEGVTAKKAFVALLAAAVVFLVQLKTSDRSAVTRFAYAVVTWLVTYLGWPLRSSDGTTCELRCGSLKAR